MHLRIYFCISVCISMCISMYISMCIKLQHTRTVRMCGCCPPSKRWDWAGSSDQL